MVCRAVVLALAAVLLLPRSLAAAGGAVEETGIAPGRASAGVRPQAGPWQTGENASLAAALQGRVSISFVVVNDAVQDVELALPLPAEVPGGPGYVMTVHEAGPFPVVGGSFTTGDIAGAFVTPQTAQGAFRIRGAGSGEWTARCTAARTPSGPISPRSGPPSGSISGGAPTPARQSPPRVLLRSGHTLVPLRYIAEWLGVLVVFDARTQKITLSGSSPGFRVVHLRLGSRQAQVDLYDEGVNRRSLILAMAPFELKGVTYVPLRFVGEALGAEVGWDASARTVTVRHPGSARTLLLTPDGR